MKNGLIMDGYVSDKSVRNIRRIIRIRYTHKKRLFTNYTLIQANREKYTNTNKQRKLLNK